MAELDEVLGSLMGGALIFCAAEWARGRPAPLRVQDFATRTGVAAIATLFLLSMLFKPAQAWGPAEL